MELMDVVFASGQRSLESLYIAFATTDRISFPAPSADIQEAADGVIRLLGSRKKLSSHDASSLQGMPGYARKYPAAVANQRNITAPSLETDVVNYLTGSGALDQSVPRLGSLPSATGQRLL